MEQEQEQIEKKTRKVKKKLRKTIFAMGRKFIIFFSCLAIRSCLKLLEKEGVHCQPVQMELEKMQKELEEGAEGDDPTPTDNIEDTKL